MLLLGHLIRGLEKVSALNALQNCFYLIHLMLTSTIVALLHFTFETAMPIKFCSNRYQYKSAQDFFELCEFYLAEPETRTASLPTLLNRMSFFIIRFFCSWGLVLSYILMVIRNGNMNIAIFRNTLIMDIKANLVLSQTEISGECKSLSLRRRHFPSMRIIREIIAASSKYKFLLNSLELKHTFEANDFAGKEITLQAITNPAYLYWMLQFYFYRSVGLANSSRIKSKVKAVLTIDEFTPSIVGYLSVLSELRIPIFLYLPIKSRYPKILLKIIPLIVLVLAKNGRDADFFKTEGFVATYFEKPKIFPNRLLRIPILRPRVGVFLASLYLLQDNEIGEFVISSIIPIINEVHSQWHPSHLTVYCHPNDCRAMYKLTNYGVSIGSFGDKREDRMSGFDISVCGNTSVVEEAINYGIPVVYCSNLDTYRHDLIGYVKDGVVIDASLGIPSLRTITDFYDESSTVARMTIYREGTLAHPKKSLLELLASASGEGDS